MFPWVNLALPFVWMWAMPLAAPIEIFSLDSQSSRVLPTPRLPVSKMERTNGSKRVYESNSSGKDFHLLGKINCFSPIIFPLSNQNEP